ncbi:MAG: aldo/keto reductase, partial [Verrucomicrobiae bacterium]|nr:aldo/keto reductase [Verrucomicrobiae bacterium]
VDVFLLHDPPIRLLEEQPDILRLLDELQRDGRVRAWGVSVRSPDDGLVAVRQFDVRVIEVNFNVTDQRARKNGLLQLCAERGVGCIVRTPLCFGFLTGLFSGDTRFAPTDHRNRWPREQRQMWADAAQAFRAAVENLHAQTPAQVALRFCLSYAGVSTVIPGMLLVAHVEENAAASAFGALSAEERRRLEEFYERQTFFWGKR